MRTAAETATLLIAQLGDANAYRRASDHYQGYDNRAHPGAKYWHKVMEIIRSTDRSRGQHALDLN